MARDEVARVLKGVDGSGRMSAATLQVLARCRQGAATLQVVATATVAAYASLGGLGRYLIDGIKVRQFYLALVGALLVTVLALLLDGILAAVVWASVPGTGRLRRPLPQPLLDDEVKFDSRLRRRTPDDGGEQPSPTVEGW